MDTDFLKNTFKSTERIRELQWRRIISSSMRQRRSMI